MHYVESASRSYRTACGIKIVKPLTRSELWSNVTCKSCLKAQQALLEKGGTIEKWTDGFDGGRAFEQKSFHRTMDRLGLPPALENETACTRLKRTLGQAYGAMLERDDLRRANEDLRKRIEKAHNALAGRA